MSGRGLRFLLVALLFAALPASAIAKQGGGEMVALERNDELMREVLVQTFGPQWQKDMGRIARGL